MTNRGSTYDAVFGYQNDNEDLVEIAVGSPIRFLPTPQGRGQTTDFLPGNHQEAFTVTGIQSGALLAWAVTNPGATRTATAASNFPEKCAEPELPSQPISILGSVIDRATRTTSSSATRTTTRSTSPSRSASPTSCCQSL